MRIGIFGGSFDPPHMAHLLLAEWIREEAALDMVWWVPNAISPHKLEHPPAHAAHREAMVRRALDGHSGHDISTIELERAAPSYTIDTLRLLQDRHPDDTFYLIIGGDSLRDFMSWRDPAGIAERVDILVYRRPHVLLDDAEALQLFGDRIRIVDAPTFELASRTIRQRIRDGRSVRFMVPASVQAYIEEEGLYKDQA